MKQFSIIVFVILFSCSGITKTKNIETKDLGFNETEILEQLDSAFNGIPTAYYPEGKTGDIKYNFFLDLEHPYFITAGNRIHLYADSTQWAIVFEKSGYETEGSNAEIELDYIGNCIKYVVDNKSGTNYITNSSTIDLISANEYEMIRNKKGTETEQFEFISPEATEVNIRNAKVKIEHDPKLYKRAGIKLDDNENPKKLIGYSDLIRYINETNPKLISATEEEIKKHIPQNLTKIMTLDQFHFISSYDKNTLPSKQETYQLIAKILVSKNPKDWNPTLKATNHWTNWESVTL